MPAADKCGGLGTLRRGDLDWKDSGFEGKLTQRSKNNPASVRSPPAEDPWQGATQRTAGKAEDQLASPVQE
eukprot:scaffold98778_cov63-Phaeocystis_antarctica.AAC.2